MPEDELVLIMILQILSSLVISGLCTSCNEVAVLKLAKSLGLIFLSCIKNRHQNCGVNSSKLFSVSFYLKKSFLFLFHGFILSRRGEQIK